MTNFIFKSPSDLQKISQQIKVSLAEQRLQRSDLNEIKFMLHKILNNEDLKATVDKYYESKVALYPEDIADLD